MQLLISNLFISPLCSNIRWFTLLVTFSMYSSSSSPILGKESSLTTISDMDLHLPLQCLDNKLVQIASSKLKCDRILFVICSLNIGSIGRIDVWNSKQRCDLLDKPKYSTEKRDICRNSYVRNIPCRKSVAGGQRSITGRSKSKMTRNMSESRSRLELTPVFDSSVRTDFEV